MDIFNRYPVGCEIVERLRCAGYEVRGFKDEGVLKVITVKIPGAVQDTKVLEEYDPLVKDKRNHPEVFGYLAARRRAEQKRKQKRRIAEANADEWAQPFLDRHGG